MFGKLRAGEPVEAMILEHNARTIRRDGQLTKVGPILQDTMLNEMYVITEKPMLAYRKQKSIPVYLVDRDSGVTVIMEKVQGDETQGVDLAIPDGTEPLSSPPDAPGASPPGVAGSSLFSHIRKLPERLESHIRNQPERLVFRNPKEVFIDGQRFAGWTVRMERDEKLIKLNTDPSTTGSAISSHLIKDNFTPPMTNRERLLMLLAGAVVGGFICLMF